MNFAVCCWHINKTRFLVSIISLFFFSLTSHAALTQAQLDRLAARLDVRYQLISNQRTSDCDQSVAAGACFQAQIKLTRDEDIALGDWRIFFSHVEPIESITSASFELRHLNGDLHYLKPLQPLNAKQTYAIPFRAAWWLLSLSDVMPNWYIAAPGLEARTIVSTRTTFDRDSGLEQWPFVDGIVADPKRLRRNDNDATVIATAEQIYRDNISELTAQNIPRLIPQAKSIKKLSDKSIALEKNGLRIQRNDFNSLELAAASNRLEQLGIKQSERGLPLNLIQSKTNLPREAYRLTVQANAITIEASESHGAFYGLQSIAALYDPDRGQIPAVEIDDAPRFSVRSLHIDVARNFHSKAVLLKVLDQMAAYKLNTLHLHFADDEGWRIEIAPLPELTRIGAYRCHEQDEYGMPQEKHCLLPQLGSGPQRNTSVNGFYSAQDYVDIVRAAQARHIQVLPSFDMPGHARAAVRSMRIRYQNLLANGAKESEAKRFLLDDIEDRTRYSSIQYYHDNTINVCLPSALDFVDTVITELQKLHKKAGQPLRQFHIGADETPGAWQQSPACRSLLDKGFDHQQIGAQFIVNVAKALHKKSIAIAAWNDGLAAINPADMPAPVQVNAWTPLFWNGHTSAHQFANLGWPVVLSFPDISYFDFPYAAHPQERGYMWGSRANDERRVFNFMPDNLPAMAEINNDRENQPYSADDRLLRDANHRITQAPLNANASFAGMQAQLWSETTRSDQQVEFMLFPRLLHFAERAWHQAEWELPYDYQGKLYSAQTDYFGEARRQQREQDWQNFNFLIGQQELSKLARTNIAYRIAPPGAIVRDGKLLMNTIYPLDLQYRGLSQNWQNWRETTTVKLPVEVRAISRDKVRTSRVQLIEQESH